MVPMALGGPWDAFPHPERGQNGGTVTHLVTFLILGSFSTRDIVFLCCTETKGGGLRAAGGGRRAVAPTQTPLVSPHPPKIAIPLLGGKTQIPCEYGVITPSRGDSNLGWVGGHQWGLSWRDRPPPAARHPPAARRPPPFCLCATQKLFLFNTEAHCFCAKIDQKSRMSPNGSPCHRFEHSGRGK